MPEVIDTAFVEILPDLTVFNRDLERGIDAAMQRVEQSVSQALSTVEQTFAETAREAGQSLDGVDADFSGVVDGADEAGDLVESSFDAAADETNDALSAVEGDFSGVVAEADSAAAELATSFDSAADEVTSTVESAGDAAGQAFDGVGEGIRGQFDQAAEGANSLEDSIRNLAAGAVALATLRTAALSAESFGSQMVVLESQLDDAAIAAGITLTSLEDLARSSSIRLGIDVEDLIRAERTILTFTDLTSDQFNRTLELSADLGEIMGRDIPGAARLLARALDDPNLGLRLLERQVGRFDAAVIENIKSLTEQGRVAEAQGLVLDILEDKFGGVAEASADSSAKIAAAGSEILRVFGTPIIGAVDENIDELLTIVDSAGPAVENLGLVFGQVIEIVAELAPAIGPAAEIIGAIPPEVFAAVGALLALNRVLGLLQRHPIVAAATVIALAIGEITGAADEAAPSVNQLELAIDNLTRGVVDDTTQQIVDLGKSVREAGEVSDDFGARVLRGIKDPLGALGGPFSEGQTRAELLAAAIEDLAEESTGLDQQLAAVARGGGADQVNAALATLSREIGITGTEFDDLAAQVLPDTVAALELVDREMESTAIATTGVAEALDTLQAQGSPTARSFADLAIAIRDSEASADDAKIVAEELGVPLEDLLEVTPLVAGAFETLAQSVEASMPRISDAVDSAMSEAEEDQRDFTMSDFEEELEDAVKNARDFNTNVRALLDAGFTDLAALAAERGPEFAAAAADALDDPDLLNRVTELMGDLDSELDRGLGIAADTAVAQAGPVGEAVFDGISEGVAEVEPFVSEFMGRDFPSAIRGGLVPSAREGQGVGRATVNGLATGLNDRAHHARNTASGVLSGVIRTAKTTGTAGAYGIGLDLMNGIARGIRQASREAQAAMTAEVDRVVRAGRLAGDIASPSRKTAREIGGPLAQGIGLGIREDVTALSAMNELITQISQTRTPIDGLGLLPSAPSTTSPGVTVRGGAGRGAGVEIGTMNIYTDDARRAGHAVVTEITDQVYLNAGRMTR